MEGIFFSRRTVGSFFFPHGTENLIFCKILSMKVIDDDDDFDDDERKKSKKTNFSSNDRSGHDDQNAYWIIKNGAILGG